MKTDLLPLALGLLTALNYHSSVRAASGAGALAVSAVPPSLAADTGGGDSSAPLLSRDGRLVIFTSAADNLVTNDTNHSLDVFAFDRNTKQMTLVSVAQVGAHSGNGRSVALDVSTNGQWVLFQSEASDLIAGDTNGVADLFVRDLATGQTLLVTANVQGRPGGGPLLLISAYFSATPLFQNASLSADGRHAVFESWASDLIVNDNTNLVDVFVRDLQAGTNFLVSVAADGQASAGGNSERPAITPNGRWIVFHSRATNLVATDTNGRADIFRRDMQTGTTVLVSVDRNGTGSGNNHSTNAVISDDGRFVAFESAALNLATNGSTAGIYLRDMETGITDLVSSQVGSSAPVRSVISADGRYTAYESQPDVFCWDRITRTCFKMTTNHLATGGGSDLSYGVEFSPDGQCCVFLSYATNLTATATTPGSCQVYLRHMETGLITLVSGTTSDAASPAVSADAAVVAFQSLADDLVPGDGNRAYDVFVREFPAANVELVSRRSPDRPSLTTAGRCSVAQNAISADGRCVVFSSSAGNLAGDVAPGFQNLFVRDLWIGSNQLVTATGAGTACSNGLHFTPAISGDGRWVVFQSTATNLVANDNNKAADVFLRDLCYGTNDLVSEAWLPGADANKYSVNPAISSNGQYVVFQSLASNLTGNDPNSSVDVFVRDTSLRTNYAVSVSLSGSCVGAQADAGVVNATPFPPLITPDGAWVLFWSKVNVTTNGNLSGSPGLFARNLRERRSVAVGIATNNVLLTGNQSASLSPGGRFAAFATWNNFIGVFDFASQTAVAAASPGRNPSLSADGRWLAFESPATNWGATSGNVVSDVFVMDRQQGTVQLVSVNASGTQGGNGQSAGALLSTDGRFVVFKSQASDLVDNDTNGVTDIFVRDLVAGATFPISAAVSGATGDGLSGNPILGSDGRTVLFESFADDLAAGDFNQTEDVFVLRLSAGDSDGDGLDDDWEMTYIGDLSQDGSGDADRDGAKDWQEFKAGTNPLDRDSVLRVMTLTSLSEGGTTIFWKSVPGKIYRVEYKDDVSAGNWVEIKGDIMATDSTSSATGVPAGQTGRRFYRVRVLD